MDRDCNESKGSKGFKPEKIKPGKISKEKADEYFQKRNEMIILVSSGLYCPECRGPCINSEHIFSNKT